MFGCNALGCSKIETGTKAPCLEFLEFRMTSRPVKVDTENVNINLSQFSIFV